MLKKILLPSILLVLAYGFWVSPNFKAIAAGVAIFLFGMLSLEEGFQAFTGGVLDRILKRTTSTTGKSVMFGIVSTSLMQSSSLVSVITVRGSGSLHRGIRGFESLNRTPFLTCGYPWTAKTRVESFRFDDVPDEFR